MPPGGAPAGVGLGRLNARCSKPTQAMSTVLEMPERRPAARLHLPQLPLRFGQANGGTVSFWHAPAVIAPNNFVYKSLSNWAFNVAVGCSHACRFCYVPSAATIKQGSKLAKYGVKDPDADWGEYVLLRPWDEQKFLASLRAAENTPRKQLKPDGNRAVIYCSTTDPYQVIRHPHPESVGAGGFRLVPRFRQAPGVRHEPAHAAQ